MLFGARQDRVGGGWLLVLVVQCYEVKSSSLGVHEVG